MVSADPSFLNQSVAFHALRQLVDSFPRSRSNSSRLNNSIVVKECESPNLFNALIRQRFAKLNAEKASELIISAPSVSHSYRNEVVTHLGPPKEAFHDSEPRGKVSTMKVGAPSLQTEKRAMQRNEGEACDKVPNRVRVFSEMEARALIERLSAVRFQETDPPNCVTLQKKRSRRSLREQEEYSKELSKPRVFTTAEEDSFVVLHPERESLADPTRQSQSVSRLSKPRTFEQMFSRYLQPLKNENMDHSSDSELKMDLPNFPLVLPKPDLSAYASNLELPPAVRADTSTGSTKYVEEAMRNVCMSIVALCDANPEKQARAVEFITSNILPSLSRRPIRQVSKKYTSSTDGGLHEVIWLLSMFQPSELCLVRLFGLLCMLKK